MNAPRFVVVTAVLCLLFALVQVFHPWTLLSVATWTIKAWVAMAAVACVVGLINA